MTFRNLLIAAAAATALAGYGAAADAASASANGTANATIVQPSSLSSSRSLEFGTIALPTTGTSTITVAADPAATTTPTITNAGGGNAYNVTSNAARAAQFHFSGVGGSQLTISSTSLTMSGLTANGAPAATAIASVKTVADNTTYTGAGPITLTSGAADIYVGGSITLEPSTTAGAKTGTVSLTVSYQ